VGGRKQKFADVKRKTVTLIYPDPLVTRKIKFSKISSRAKLYPGTDDEITITGYRLVR
jgi:hypothetical protein